MKAMVGLRADRKQSRCEPPAPRADQHPLAGRNPDRCPVLYFAFDAKRLSILTADFADPTNCRGGLALIPLHAMRPQFAQKRLFVGLEWQLDAQPQTRHRLYNHLSGNSRDNCLHRDR